MTTKTPTKTATPDLEDLAARLDRIARFETTLWDDAPDVAKAEQRATRLPVAVQQLTAAAGNRPDIPNVIASALNTLLDGDTLDVDRLHTDLAAAVGAVATREAIAQATANQSMTLANDARTARTTHADVALRQLDQAVRDLADVGRALLPAADTAGTTLTERGRQGQARALFEAAAAVHDAIRVRQSQLTVSYRFTAGHLARQYGIVRDVSGLNPWATWLATDPSDTTWTRSAVLADFVDAGGVPLLRLICSPGLEPWVPTGVDLEAAQISMNAAVDQARWDRTHPNQDTEFFEDSNATLSLDGEKNTSHVSAETFGARRAPRQGGRA